MHTLLIVFPSRITTGVAREFDLVWKGARASAPSAVARKSVRAFVPTRVAAVATEESSVSGTSVSPSESVGAGTEVGGPLEASSVGVRVEYPYRSRVEGEEGRVVLRLSLSAEGRVSEARVAESSGFERLDRAALSAARQHEFVGRSGVIDLAFRFVLR